MLNGTKALDYVRTRHDSNYDFGRMERQQRFINAVREQAMGWNLPLKLPGLIKALFGNVDTDLTANEFLKLAYWGVKLDGERMRLAKIMGGVQTIDSISYVVASPEEIQKAVKDFFTEPEPVDTDDDLPAPSNADIKTADLSGVSVSVVNGTGRLGQGALAAVWLLRQGASVTSIKEPDEPVEGSAVVTYPSGRTDAARAVALALGIARTRQSGRSGQILVTLGTTYGISGDQIPASATVDSGETGAPVRPSQERSRTPRSGGPWRPRSTSPCLPPCSFPAPARTRSSGAIPSRWATRAGRQSGSGTGSALRTGTWA